MSADVVATQCPGCCGPMMAVENAIPAAACPHLDGRQWLVLAHASHERLQAGVIPSRRHDRVWVHPCADSRDGQRLYPCAVSARWPSSSGSGHKLCNLIWTARFANHQSDVAIQCFRGEFLCSRVRARSRTRCRSVMPMTDMVVILPRPRTGANRVADS